MDLLPLYFFFVHHIVQMLLHPTICFGPVHIFYYNLNEVENTFGKQIFESNPQNIFADDRVQKQSQNNIIYVNHLSVDGVVFCAIGL